jgi:hypothetical protein
MSQQRQPKVFGIGFQKTATSSLGEALELLGYSVHGPFGWTDPEIRYTALHRAMSIANDYDAFQDFPWALLYKQLDDKFPGSKFILTLRDEECWFKSMVKHFGVRATPMREWVYGVPYPRGQRDIYIQRYRSHNEEVKSYFQGRPNDLLVMNITEGDAWNVLCPFLGHAVPDADFPRANTTAKRRWSRFRRYLNTPWSSSWEAIKSYHRTFQFIINKYFVF